jgi:hypothetical protein
MLNLNKSITSNIVVTVTSDSYPQVSGSAYLLNLYSQQQNEPVQIVINDISTYPWRYNKFVIPSGSFSVLAPSTYNYWITTSGSTPNIELERGKCLLTDVTGSQTQWYDSQTDNTFRYVDLQQ